MDPTTGATSCPAAPGASHTYFRVSVCPYCVHDRTMATVPAPAYVPQCTCPHTVSSNLRARRGCPEVTRRAPVCPVHPHPRVLLDLTDAQASHGAPCPSLPATGSTGPLGPGSPAAPARRPHVHIACGRTEDARDVPPGCPRSKWTQEQRGTPPPNPRCSSRRPAAGTETSEGPDASDTV